ncbi:MAG: metal-dependent phosphohydrolase [Nitrospira bacterium HGW-Nitrospira-1]|nr:MAG: metal-dependent phosphohydrolase [Nitrospira bacterium HGW-Nitrospira-1]
MKFKIDLHVHSKYSGDTDSEPEEAVLHAIGLNLQGIAFTEHYYFAASEHAEGLREKYRDRILIFRGVEFSTEEGHCLIFGVDTDSLALRYAPVEDVIRMVTMHGGVVIPSHPYRTGNSLGDRVYDLNGISAVEGYNGYNMHVFNIRAIEAARALNLSFTGGSDAHAPGEVGSCFTEFNDEVTADNFIELLKLGNYQGVDTRKISRWIF